MKNFKDYKSEIINGSPIKQVVDDARNDYSITIKLNHQEEDQYSGAYVPFNLERIYVDELIDKYEYEEASKILNRMRFSYTDTDQQNFIEVYEYHLKSIKQSEETIKNQIREAKKEFNAHTITLVSIIVGIITIFGTANKTLEAKNFQEAFLSFFVISFTIIFLIFMVSEINKKVNK